MKIRMSLLAIGATLLLVAPAGYGATAKQAPHRKTTKGLVTAHAPKPKVKANGRPAARTNSETVWVTDANILSTSTPSPSTMVPASLSPAEDPGAADCTYMVCAASDQSAEETGTSDSTAPASTDGQTSSAEPSPSQLCQDDSYLC